MKPRDIFEVCVRVLGLLFLYKGLSSIPDAIIGFCPFLQSPAYRGLNFRSLLLSLIYIGIPMVLGWWMLRGAPWLMRKAFGETASASRNTPLSTPPQNPQV